MKTIALSRDCADPEDLAAFLCGRLDSGAVGRLERHLADCADCRQLLSALAPSSDGAAAAATADEASRAETLPYLAGGDAELAVGTRVGRYIVLYRLGAGGMGVVYAAYDPELARKVALKIWRGGAYDPLAQAELRERLRSEAQAMARLAHPNVVAVHDVGAFGDRIFVAMELIEGQTLAAWLAAAPRSWREIVATLVASGRGLEAAHAADLVHRDFKPENVLIGNDGRVRVGDFGLARVVAPAPLVATAADSLDSLAERWSRTGTLAGTPFYMAPEQYLDGAVDARSDQFSFCVTLYSAIVGAHPFAGHDAETLTEAVVQGRRAAAPRRDPLPRWLRRVLDRGLAGVPEARHASMSELLALLGRDPIKRAGWIAAVTLSLTVLALGLALASRPRTVDPKLLCSGASAKWAGIWDPTRAAAVERAFGASGKPYAATAFARVASRLESYVRSWTVMHTEACEATRVRGEQSEEMLDRRMLCLEEGRAVARAISDRFVAADGEVVDEAVRTAERLGDVSACADRQTLASQVRPPADAATRARVADLHRELAAVVARQTESTTVDRDRERARTVAATARALRYRPLEAEALFVLAGYEHASGDATAAAKALEESIWAAEAGHADEQAARSWILLMQVEGRDQGNFAEALTLAPRVTALLERVGGSELLEGELEVARARVLSALNRLVEAQAAAERARLLFERRFGPDDVRVADALDGLAEVAVSAARHADARHYLERELAIKERAFGKEHPEIGRVETTLATVYMYQIRYDDADAHFRRAQAILDRSVGPRHPLQAVLAHYMAVLYEAKGDFRRALELQARAVEIGAATLGKEHPTYASYLCSYGSALVGLGRHREALAQLDEGLAVAEERLGPEHSRVATCLAHTVEPLYELGRYEEARAASLRAIALYEKRFGAKHADLRGMLLLLGMTELGLSQATRAVPPLERALAFGTDGDPGEYAEIEWHLAEALVASQGDSPRAATLIAHARQRFLHDPRLGQDLAALEAWSKRRRAQGSRTGAPG